MNYLIYLIFHHNYGKRSNNFLIHLSRYIPINDYQHIDREFMEYNYKCEATESTKMVMCECGLSMSLEGYVDTCINSIIIFAYGHDRGRIIDNAIGTPNTYFGGDMIGKVYCAT